jgi:hypothetical protein
MDPAFVIHIGTEWRFMVSRELEDIVLCSDEQCGSGVPTQISRYDNVSDAIVNGGNPE